MQDCADTLFVEQHCRVSNVSVRDMVTKAVKEKMFQGKNYFNTNDPNNNVPHITCDSNSITYSHCNRCSIILQDPFRKWDIYAEDTNRILTFDDSNTVIKDIDDNASQNKTILKNANQNQYQCMVIPDSNDEHWKKRCFVFPPRVDMLHNVTYDSSDSNLVCTIAPKLYRSTIENHIVTSVKFHNNPMERIGDLTWGITTGNIQGEAIEFTLVFADEGECVCAYTVP